MAALTKLSAPQAFASRLELSVQLPAWLAWGIAAYLPWLELTCGFCLILGVAQREAALVLSVLLLIFLGWPLVQPPADNCGCLLFPPALEPLNTGWRALVRNLVLLGCALGLACSSPRPPHPAGLSIPSAQPAHQESPPLT